MGIGFLFQLFHMLSNPQVNQKLLYQHCVFLSSIFLSEALTANRTYMGISRNFSSAEGQLRLFIVFSNDSSKSSPMHHLTMRAVRTANTMHATRNLCVLPAYPSLAQVVFHPRFSAWKMFCQESHCLGEITSDLHSAATKVLDIWSTLHGTSVPAVTRHR